LKRRSYSLSNLSSDRELGNVALISHPTTPLSPYPFSYCVFLEALPVLKTYYAIKVKVKVKFSLEQATKAQRGSRGIALLFP
jgi:hypothetical protein